MDDKVMCEFRKYDIARDMWSALKEKIVSISVVKLRALTIKFDTFKKHPDHDMRKYLKIISNMVNELKDADHILMTNNESKQ